MLKNLFILAACAYLVGKVLDKRSNAKVSPPVEPSAAPWNPVLPPEWAARIRGDRKPGTSQYPPKAAS